MIFSPGIQGAVPHNTGEADTPLRLGVPIIFDLFPREMGGGFFHAATRTWCFGYAPDAVQALFDDVHACFRQMKAQARPGVLGRKMQKMTCDCLRGRGHPVIADDPTLLEGYIHGLGHGAGLAIHEAPSLSPSGQEPLAPGHVFTIEPGLYYTSREMGARIEDTVYLNAEGELVTITDAPYDLVVPVE